jgi:hypothetical protein
LISSFWFVTDDLVRLTWSLPLQVGATLLLLALSSVWAALGSPRLALRILLMGAMLACVQSAVFVLALVASVGCRWLGVDPSFFLELLVQAALGLGWAAVCITGAGIDLAWPGTRGLVERAAGLGLAGGRYLGGFVSLQLGLFVALVLGVWFFGVSLGDLGDVFALFLTAAWCGLVAWFVWVERGGRTDPALELGQAALGSIAVTEFLRAVALAVLIFLIRAGALLAIPVAWYNATFTDLPEPGQPPQSDSPAFSLALFVGAPLLALAAFLVSALIQKRRLSNSPKRVVSILAERAVWGAALGAALLVKASTAKARPPADDLRKFIGTSFVLANSVLHHGCPRDHFFSPSHRLLRELSRRGPAAIPDILDAIHHNREWIENDGDVCKHAAALHDVIRRTRAKRVPP